MENLEENAIVQTEVYKALDKAALRLIVVDRAMASNLTVAFDNLHRDGLTGTLYSQDNIENSSKLNNTVPTSSAGIAIKSVTNAMRKTGHALHRGTVYCRYENGKLLLNYQ